MFGALNFIVAVYRLKVAATRNFNFFFFLTYSFLLFQLLHTTTVAVERSRRTRSFYRLFRQRPVLHFVFYTVQTAKLDGVL